MLKLLHIKNFQSHKDTTIQFSNGFNVFEGQSDGGKSAIIRAIAAVCYNRWNNQSIRLGQEQTVIQLVTDLGYVKLIKNQKQKINSYVCKKNGCEQQIYETVGTTVPQSVYQITGMRQLNVGDSVTDIPNIMFQLEKHYMLAQVNGKSCTSNLIARIFDKVIGLGGMEQLITSISSSMINDKKAITKNMSQIDQLKLKMINQQQIQQKQNKLNFLKITKNEIEKIEKDIQKINFICSQYEKQVQKMNNLNKHYIDFDVKTASEFIRTLVDKKQKYKMLNQILISNDKFNSDLLKSNKIIQKYKNVTDKQVSILKTICNKYFIANKILNSIQDKNKKLQQCQSIICKFKNIDNSKNIVQELKLQCNSLYKISKLIQKRQNNLQKIKSIENNIQQFSNKYEINSKKLNDLKQKYKICPICGNPFSNYKEKI